MSVEEIHNRDSELRSEFDDLEPRGDGRGPGIRVLLAEDNSTNRFVAKTFLEKKGYTVHCANNGTEALELFGKREFDIILMDIMMPVMDGMEATRRIRSGHAGRNASIPIIALTACAMKGDRERFLRHGMDEYMSKPVDFRSLFDVIERLAFRCRGNGGDAPH
jgi:CheY-like chemotaxis protein